MFSTKIKTRFFDADPAGIIFYGNIFKYIHSAYEDFIAGLRLKRNYFLDKDFVLPILHAEADYHLPIKYGETLTINIEVTKLKRSSFELSYKIFNNKKVEVATAKTVHVCVSKNTFKKIEMPDELFNKLNSHLQNLND
ncbi:acyl-CoA thioesterase [Rosettibacter firmus]|uniref:acyl-CoA thioesterase n=1 Tax=Rosettibacter firmus TaxID=3111522 RepID=UPI00336BDA76